MCRRQQHPRRALEVRRAVYDSHKAAAYPFIHLDAACWWCGVMAVPSGVI
jgi:hypothetical protein